MKFPNKNSRVKNNEKEMEINSQNLHFQENISNDITKNLHYVGPSTMLMMRKLLKWEVLKLWNAFFVVSIFVNNLNPTIKHGKDLITYYKTYGIIGLKIYVDANHVIIEE